MLTRSKKCFELSEHIQSTLAKHALASGNKKMERSPYKVMQHKKATLCRQNLKRRHFQLIFIIHKMIKLMLSVSLYSTEVLIDGALVLCSLHNGSVELTMKNSKSLSGAQVCSNSFPILLLAPKIFDVGMILQVNLMI